MYSTFKFSTGVALSLRTTSHDFPPISISTGLTCGFSLELPGSSPDEGSEESPPPISKSSGKIANDLYSVCHKKLYTPVSLIIMFPPSAVLTRPLKSSTNES